MPDIKVLWRRFPLGAPSRYAVLAVVLSLVWFPIRFWLLDRGDPPAEVVAGAAFSGVVWALYPWLTRFRRPRAEWTAGDPAGDPAEIRARARLGAVVGMGIGVLFCGSLIAMSLIMLRERWLYAATFAVVLLLMGVAAGVSLRRASPREPERA